MTHVVVTRRNNRIVSVECTGHTGYGEQGEDIVCAALSSIVQTAALGLLQVVGLKLDYRTDERGYLKMALPDDLDEKVRHDCDIVLETMLLGVADLNQGYSDFIELEVK